jgi:subtilisin family serine protease
MAPVAPVKQGGIMKRGMNQRKIIAAALAAFLAPLFASASPDAVPGEFVVRLKPGVLSAFQLGAESESLSADTLLVKGVKAETLRGQPGVDLVEPNYIYRALESFDWGLENLGQKNCHNQRGVAGMDVKARDAWQITKGRDSVVVAVIDTGVDVEHPRLREKILVNEAEAAGAEGVDDDRNGYVDDVYGYDFTREKGLSGDDNGHGTFCAGQIAASAGDDGIAGLAPDVKLLPVKFLDSQGGGTLANAIKAIDYAVARGATVLSNSWGGGQRSALLEASIRSAQEKGVVFVAAAGNSGANNERNPTYPASYPVSNVISVAAVNNTGELSRFSNHGRNVHVAAPGAGLLGLRPQGGTACLSGTSMAAPYVAAAAALTQSLQPGMSAEAIKARIISTSTAMPGFGGSIAGGLLNTHALLQGL